MQKQVRCRYCGSDKATTFSKKVGPCEYVATVVCDVCGLAAPAAMDVVKSVAEEMAVLHWNRLNHVQKQPEKKDGGTRKKRTEKPHVPVRTPEGGKRRGRPRKQVPKVQSQENPEGEKRGEESSPILPQE